MKPLTILIISLVVSGLACKKENDRLPSPGLPLDDRKTVLLKEIVEEKLPSPYFHFNYNNSSFVTDISFADGLVHYDVAYQQGKVSSLKNRIDASVLNYEYNNGKVVRITKSNGGGLSWTYLLAYNKSQLKEVRWYRHTGTDSVLERKVELFYGSNDNLSDYNDYWNNGNELKLRSHFVFSDYDGDQNVDDFYLFKNFFEDLLFLPGVKLQKNNPGLVQIVGEQNDYEISYRYSYQNGLPVQREGWIKQTRGGETKPVQLLTTYSYY